MRIIPNICYSIKVKQNIIFPVRLLQFFLMYFQLAAVAAGQLKDKKVDNAGYRGRTADKRDMFRRCN